MGPGISQDIQSATEAWRGDRFGWIIDQMSVIFDNRIHRLRAAGETRPIPFQYCDIAGVRGSCRRRQHVGSRRNRNPLYAPTKFCECTPAAMGI